ncbi:hypothetical protein [Streptomyces sp. NBC_00690]|uniref:hypothetical protein n=1 Tax=Streptomyces sp. NBC_00690 TaxID=2975808 RepID=UPI002E2D4DE1|nr:hypothetical protein [Streptomyces sp. NBC_00690]
MTGIDMEPRHGRDCKAAFSVEWHLQGLGFTPAVTRRDGVSYQTLPEGLGWCQTLPVPEEAWPPGATQCVVVRWYPDRTYRRDRRTGLIPAGADEHWRDRTTDIMGRLRALGFWAENTGPYRAPALHTHEDILVWRQPGDRHWPPVSAWFGSEPASTHFGPPSPAEREAVLRVRGVLRQVERGRRRIQGTLSAEPALPAWWPPHAGMCVRVLWQPTVQYQRDPNSVVAPPGAARHWHTGIESIRRALIAASYEVQEPVRPRTPTRDTCVGFLAWRRLR